MTTPTTPNPPSDTPSGDGAATATKKKRTAKRADIALFYSVKESKGIEAEIARALKAGHRVLIELPKPPGINERNVRSKGAYKPAIRTALETAKSAQAAQDYNNKEILIVGLHDSFAFKAKVEQVTTTKVTFDEPHATK